MRLGIFGGSFDPVHIGHLWIAEAALESLCLDRLHWIPAAQNPLKPNSPVASNEDRLQMLRLAVAGAPPHWVDDREIRRGDISFTIDTVTELRNEHPEAELFLILGSDSLADFIRWRHPDRLLQTCTLSVVQRGGQPPIDYHVLNGLVSDEQIQRIQQHEVTMPVIEISSTELRQRIAEGRSIRFRTPRAVEAFIADRRLYRNTGR